MKVVDFAAPPIAPVRPDISRPRWSVMIPVRDRLQFLEQCLRSVLDQAPGPDEMQIEVVDNSTTDKGVKHFVRSIADSRVAYYKQPLELTMAQNWNSCVTRANGHFVHILH